MMRTDLIFVGLAFAATVGCRPTPGDPDYPDPTPYVDTSGDGFLPGPDPFEPGDRRLSFGAFYEGESSDQILVDDVTVHYYIYEGSFSQSVDSERIEGFQSDRLTVSSSTWWGGGIHLDDAADLTSWDTLHIALWSEDAAMSALQLGMVGAGGEVRVTPGDYGFAPDGEWHVLDIPMSALSGAGLEATTVGLLIISAAADPGTSVLIDDFYLKGE